MNCANVVAYVSLTEARQLIVDNLWKTIINDEKHIRELLADLGMRQMFDKPVNSWTMDEVISNVCNCSLLDYLFEENPEVEQVAVNTANERDLPILHFCYSRQEWEDDKFMSEFPERHKVCNKLIDIISEVFKIPKEKLNRKTNFIEDLKIIESEQYFSFTLIQELKEVFGYVKSWENNMWEKTPTIQTLADEIELHQLAEEHQAR